MSDRIRFVAVVLALLLVFCLLEAGIESAFFSSRGFVTEFLAPDLHQAYVRTLGCVFIIATALFWQAALRRRERIGRALQASKDLYRDLVENCPENIIVHRGETILYLNRMALGFLGVDRAEDIADRTLDDFIHPDDRAYSRARRSRTLQGGVVPGGAELRLTLPDGSVRIGEVSSVRIMFEGEPAVLTFCRDITEEQVTRERLATSEERLSLALDAASDGVWDWDMARDRLVYNQAWARMLGLDPLAGDYSPEMWAGLVHPDDKDRVLAAAEAHIRGESPSFETEVRLRHADGHYIWVLDRGKVVERAPDGTPLRMAGTHRDITARKEAELALELRNRIAEAFLTSAPGDVFGRVLALTCEALGSPSGLLASFEPGATVRVATYEREGPGAADRVIGRDTLPSGWEAILESGEARIDNEASALTFLGTATDRSVTVPILSHGRPLGLVVVADGERPYEEADARFLDSLAGYLAPILDFHLANQTKESQLRQAQKMEAIGALAEGIAHDFNNILQAVLGFTTLALEEAAAIGTPEGDFIAKDLERVVKAAQRGRELVNRILLFSRRQEQERQPVIVGDLIEESVALLAGAIPATIEIVTLLDAACRPVLADPSQLSLMLMNLATNGFHAMEKDGGTLTFTTRHVAADGADAAGLPERLRHRDLVVVTVADTGCGMDEATLARLYDPFFTTKDVGKGTGLGLSVVHGIVAGHEGEIVIESAPGRGTTATITLPAHEPAGACDDGTAGPFPGADARARVKPGSRILFLDDESDIGALGKALLEKQGHRVIAFDDTRAALESLERAPGDFDLLITDLTMPHMTGDQIASRVGEIRPDLPVILITGLNDVPIETFRAHPQIRGVLRKPFGGDTLRETVREVLDKAGETGTAGRDGSRT